MAKSLKDIIRKNYGDQVIIDEDHSWKLDSNFRLGEGLFAGMPLGTFFRASPDIMCKINPALLRSALHSQLYGLSAQGIHKRLSLPYERMVFTDMEGYGDTFIGVERRAPKDADTWGNNLARLLHRCKSHFIYDEVAFYGGVTLKQYEEREKLRKRLAASVHNGKPELPKLAYYTGSEGRVRMPRLTVAFADVWSMRRAVWHAIIPE